MEDERGAKGRFVTASGTATGLSVIPTAGFGKVRMWTASRTACGSGGVPTAVTGGCFNDGERVEGDRDCVASEDSAMQASASGARMRSGPGEGYEGLGRLAEGGKVKVVGRAAGGAWLRVEAPGGGEGLRFVRASELEEAVGSSWNFGEVFRDCPECPELVVVPPGSFEMGSPSGGRNEGPVHRVTFERPFAVGVYEVTFGEWDACVSGGGCGGYRPNDRNWGRGNRPVFDVSWDDVKAYVDWLDGEDGGGVSVVE